MPYQMSRNIEALKHWHPELEHHIYEDEELRELIEKHFGREVAAAWDGLVPLAYRADLGRYCLMHEFGGLYADLSVMFLCPIFEEPADRDRLIVFRDDYSAAPWITSIGILAAPPGEKVFQACIEKICENVRRQNYGVNSLCPTGPNLFGASLATHADLKKLKSGKALRVNENRPYSNFAFVSRSGELTAVSHKRSLGISSLGAGHHSSYGELYEARAIYGGGRQHWEAEEFSTRGWTESSFRRTPDSIVLSGDRSPVLYGPYISLDPGKYECTICVRANSPDGHLDWAVEFSSGAGEQRIGDFQHIRVANSPVPVEIKLQFSTSYIQRLFEVRVWQDKPGESTFYSLTLQKLA